MNKQVFKVVRREDYHVGVRLLSARLRRTVGPYTPIAYTPGKWVYASDGISKLFAFEDRQAAVYFNTGAPTHGEVWLAEATGVEKCPHYVPDIFRLQGRVQEVVKRWWGKVRRCTLQPNEGPDSNHSFGSLNLLSPKGSVLCTSIKLISHVN